ncbi:MAG: S41 family peptidase [Planctomycetaceae bacterium]|nr:S41 family peptidase [Planctomycetaceae bacterium]
MVHYQTLLRWMSRSACGLIFSAGCGLVLQPSWLAADEPPAEQTADQQSSVQDDYELMKLFVETFERIDSNYVREVDRRELMEAAIHGMLEHLDQYSSYIPPQDVRRFDQVFEQEFGGVGIQVNGNAGRLTVVSPLPGTPAFRAGIRSGDVIVEVDGKSTEGFTVNDAVKALQGPTGRAVRLKVKRASEAEPLDIEVVREVIQVPTVLGDHYNHENKWEYMLDETRGIGLIRVTHFSRHTTEELREAIRGLSDRGLNALVLDLRSNPGGLLEAAIEIADMFMDTGRIVSVRGRTVKEQAWDAKSGTDCPPVPVAVLVNRFSASASEVLSACLQDNQRAVVVGERTWGKGSVQNVIRMESGESALKLTTASYHRPSGINIHRFPDSKPEDDWGVKPSDGFEVKMSSEDWEAWQNDREIQDVLLPEGSAAPERTFKDPQLTKALAWLDEEMKKVPQTAGSAVSE